MPRKLKNIYSLFTEAGLEIFDRNAPDFIKNHPELQKRKNINKVFPSFGLKNFREKVTVENNSTKAEEEFIRNVLSALTDQIDTMGQNLNLIRVELPEDDQILPYLITNYFNFLKAVKKALQNASIQKKDGKTKLLLTVDVTMAYKTILRAGDSVFKVFHKINTLTESLLKKYPELKNKWNLILPNPDSLLVVKQFHSSHLPSKDYYIVFSSEGDTGAWDIATMSMRGISSCQRWGDEVHRTCLIGSILSRYVGIIYFTSGSQEKHGEKMIRRCIVRFGIHKNTGEKLIILDRMYDSYDATIADYFVDALQKRTNLKVLNYSQADNLGPELPIAWDVIIPQEGLLKKLDTSELPYLNDVPFTTSYTNRKKEIINKDELANHLNVIADMIYNDVVAYIQDTFTNTQSIIANIAVSLLQNQLEELTERAKRNNLGHKLAVKFIKSQIFKMTDELSKYDVEKILPILFPHRASWTIQKHLEEMGTNTLELQYVVSVIIEQYKKSLSLLLQ